MSRHPPGDRVNGVGDLDALMLEDVGHFLERMLGLGDRHAIAGHDDDLAGILEHEGSVFRRALFGIALRAGQGGSAAIFAETAENDRDEGAIHALAHDVGQDRTGGAHQGTGHKKRRVFQREAECGGGPAGIGIEHRDDHRHVGAANRDDQGYADDESGERDQPEGHFGLAA